MNKKTNDGVPCAAVVHVRACVGGRTDGGVWWCVEKREINYLPGRREREREMGSDEGRWPVVCGVEQ